MLDQKIIDIKIWRSGQKWRTNIMHFANGEITRVISDISEIVRESFRAFIKMPQIITDVGLFIIIVHFAKCPIYVLGNFEIDREFLENYLKK